MKNLTPAGYVAHFIDSRDPKFRYQSYRCAEHLSESNYRLVELVNTASLESCVICLESVLAARREQSRVFDTDAG